jgi:hypothetical protein
VRDGNLLKDLMAALYSAVALSGVGLLVAFGYVAYGSAHLHHFLGRSKGNEVAESAASIADAEMRTPRTDSRETT